MSETLKKGNNQVLGVFFQQYAQYCCHRLCAENTCTEDDARDFFVESVMSLRERIIREPEVPVMNIRTFLYKACQNMYRSSLRLKIKARHEMADLERFYYQSEYLTSEQKVFDEQLLAVTLRAWGTLSERCQDLSLIHISEPTRLRRISYAVFCSKKKIIY